MPAINQKVGTSRKPIMQLKKISDDPKVYKIRKNKSTAIKNQPSHKNTGQMPGSESNLLMLIGKKQEQILTY